MSEKRSRRDHEQTARDVLARRLELSASELVELVHAVNPTGRSASKADERRRYELKSRLQSLLIVSFADSIEVREESHGIIAIRHRYAGHDACHARMDELEIEARSIVRKLLDTGVDVPVPAQHVASESQSVARVGVLEQGQRALAAFDFETARACFEQAAGAGDLAASRALLELLVDHLVLDEDALDVATRLAPEIAADPDVRALLGLAAARIGRRSEAAKFLHDLAIARAADGRALLAREALDRGAWHELDAELVALERCDPAHPELRTLREDKVAARARTRGPEEHELLQLVEHDPVAAEAAARALLERWPDSAVAGRVLGRIQRDRRRGEGERLRALAEQALAEEQWQRADELAHQASALEIDVAALLEQIRKAADADRAVRAATAVQHACDLLTGELRAGLQAYVDLGQELRRRVRDRDTRPMLRWLDIVLEHARRARLRDAVDAVIALARAYESPDDEALALIAPYDELLAPVPATRELRSAIQRRAAAQRSAVATSTLADAAKALHDGDFARCEHACLAIDPRDLGSDDQARRERLIERSRGLRAIDRGRARAEELIAADDFVAARRELAAVISHPMLETDRAAALRERLAIVEAEVRRRWRVQVTPCMRRLDDCDPIGELLGRLPYEEHVVHWVTPDRDLVLVGAHGEDVHIMWVSLDRRCVIRRGYLHAPDRLGGELAICIDRDSLWIVGRYLLQLDLATGEPRRWESLDRFVGGRLERVFVMPGASHIWIEGYDPERPMPYRIVDLNRGQIVREVPSARSIHPVVGNGKIAMLGLPFDGGALLQSERGAVLETLPACDGVRVTFGAFDPKGNLVVGVGGIDDDDACVYLRGLTAGRATYDHLLPDTHPDLRISAATGSLANMMFIDHASSTGVGHLVALRFGERTVEPVWRLDMDASIVFAQDATCREVVCLSEGRSGVLVSVLGPEPPVLQPLSDAEALPAVAGYFHCAPHGESRLAGANEAARRGDWTTVRDELESLPVESLSPHDAAHGFHLLGLALLRTGGDRERVREMWTQGLEIEKSGERFLDCGFQSLLHLIDDPVTDAQTHELRRAMAAADACDDPRAALAAIRRRAVTRHGEPQSFGRLVAAWLAIETSDDERLDKAIALARFIECTPANALPIPEAWPVAQLDELVERARSWLDLWRAHPETR